MDRGVLLHVFRQYTINADEVIDDFIKSENYSLLEIWYPFEGMELKELKQIIENN